MKLNTFYIKYTPREELSYIWVVEYKHKILKCNYWSLVYSGLFKTVWVMKGKFVGRAAQLLLGSTLDSSVICSTTFRYL